MTTAATRPPMQTASGGAPPEENKAALGFAAAGFVLGGPIGLVVACMAVGIERAFLGSPWEQPGWLGGSGRPKLTPEQLEERRAEARRMAREVIEDLRQRAADRAQARQQHRKAYKEWWETGKGDKPSLDHRRLAEFLDDLYRGSKAWCRLFDEKWDKADAWVEDKVYAPSRKFFNDLWKFIGDFVEGTRDEWDRQKRLREEQQKLDEEWRAGEETSTDPRQIGTGDQTSDSTTTDPAGPQGPADPQNQQDPLQVDAELGPEQRQIIEDGTSGPDGQDPTNPDGPGPAALDAEQLDTDPTSQTRSRPAAGNSPVLEGELMTADNQPLGTNGTSPARTRGPQGTTNLDLLLKIVAVAPPLLNTIGFQTTEMRAVQSKIAATTAGLTQIAAAAGAPYITDQLLEAGLATVGELNRGLLQIARDNAEASALIEVAVAGLEPASDNLDATHSTGASGDMYDRPQD